VAGGGGWVGWGGGGWVFFGVCCGRQIMLGLATGTVGLLEMGQENIQGGNAANGRKKQEKKNKVADRGKKQNRKIREIDPSNGKKKSNAPAENDEKSTTSNK